MRRYAYIDGIKNLPKPGLRGICPGCGNALISHCGPLHAWHWQHKAGPWDCDSWADSRDMGPWHESWQDFAHPDSVEVSRGAHRADIVGDSNTVLELQHSPITATDIAEREQFYGQMIWLFDATKRFGGVRSGDRYFFSLKAAGYISACKKPVFLDFGDCIVEVERFTDRLDKFSGFGRVRAASWFAEKFLSGCRRDSASLPKNSRTEPDWVWRLPWKAVPHPSRWIDSGGNQFNEYPAQTPYLCLDGKWSDSTQPLWADVIDAAPELAYGWDKDELRAMMRFVRGTPMILGGLLRLMPSAAHKIPVNQYVPEVEALLGRADVHARYGRMPPLRDTTKQQLLEEAERFTDQQLSVFAR